MGGKIPPVPPPIDTRSLPSVERATVQPSFGVPTTSSSGTKTSLKKTSLKSALPVIWRSGRTSTPGACMSITIVVMPGVLRARRGRCAPWPGRDGSTGPRSSTPSGR